MNSISLPPAGSPAIFLPSIFLSSPDWQENPFGAGFDRPFVAMLRNSYRPALQFFDPGDVQEIHGRESLDAGIVLLRIAIAAMLHDSNDRRMLTNHQHFRMANVERPAVRQI